jgi:hypothetical protein
LDNCGAIGIADDQYERGDNSSNTIGGPLVGDRNIISGKHAAGEGDGIFIPDQLTNPLGILVTGTCTDGRVARTIWIPYAANDACAHS